MAPSAEVIHGIIYNPNEGQRLLIERWRGAKIPQEGGRFFLCRIGARNGLSILGIIDVGLAGAMDDGSLRVPIRKGTDETWAMAASHNVEALGNLLTVGSYYEKLGMEYNVYTRKTEGVSFECSSGETTPKGTVLTINGRSICSRQEYVGKACLLYDELRWRFYSAWATVEELTKAFPELATIEPVDFKAWLAEARATKATA